MEPSIQPPRMGVLKRLAVDARSYAVPQLRRLRGSVVAHLNGISKVLGVDYGADETLRVQWSRVLRRCDGAREELPEPTGPRVLMATVHGFGQAMLTFESILAVGLRLRGATPTFLMCGGALPACEWNPLGNHGLPSGPFGQPTTERSKLDRCRYCTQAIEDPYRRLPIPLANLREFLRSGDLERAAEVVDGVPYDSYRGLEHNGVRVGEHAFSSVLRATLRGTLEGDERTRWMYRRYLVSAVLAADLVGRVLEALRPERVVAHHGIYLTHGILCEAASKRGIPVVVHGISSRTGTVILSRDDTYHRTLITEPNSEWEDLQLTPEQREKIDRYVASKRFGGRDYVSYHTDAIDDPEAIRMELGLKRDLPIVSLFTNVLWDAQLYYQYNAFDNMLQWLFETIRYFQGREDLQLVIRVHPAEERGEMPTNQPLVEEIRREFLRLPWNVKVIPPGSRLSSYTLAEMSQAALIYGARMGVEIALCGTPLIVAGETFNRRKGFSYDVETRAEYFKLLDRVKELSRNPPDMIERARRYAYHLYFRRMIDFPLFSVREGMHLTGPRLEFRELADLTREQNRSLDVLCEGIISGKPFVYDG